MKNTITRSFLFVSAFLFISVAYGQITVSGTVKDATGPLPGVNVSVKGTDTGTVTDFDGNYTLSNVPEEGILVFSFVGFTTQEIGVERRTTINVSMELSAAELEQVVVIGYGQTTVKDATGAVSAVTSKEFNRGVIASPEELIQGKTAGVQIAQNSGEPGSGVAVRIRGSNSIRSNNNPLFVVDGVPLSGGDTSGGGTDIGFGSSTPRNPLNFLNPNDIESISILKDASATAIYGSRGANGVIIITTKSGRGVTGSTYEWSSTYSVGNYESVYNLLTAQEFLEAREARGLNVEQNDFGSATDWQDFVLRTAVSTTQNVGYNYNHESGSVRVTGSYSNQEGIIEKSSLERLTGRLNLNQRLLDDKLKLNLQGTLSRVYDESAPLSGSAGFQGDLLGATYSANPTWPKDPNFADTGGLLSPATLLAFTDLRTETDRVLANFTGEYAVTDELSGKITLGYDWSESYNSQMASKQGRNIGQGTFTNGNGVINKLELESNLLEAIINYNKEFENSRLEALVGYSFQDFETTGRNTNGFGFETENLTQMSEDLAASANLIERNLVGSWQQYGFAPNLDRVFVNRLFPEPTRDFVSPNTGLRVRSIFTDTFSTKDELQSVFARANYTLFDKYLFTGTFRLDGSSKFGDNNEYGEFFSGAFAWKAHNEDFIGDFFTTLKLRLGAGVTGNQEGLGFGNFVKRQRFSGGDIIGDGGQIDNIPGIQSVSFPNPDLQWEETTQYTAGIDYGFFNDRLSGSIDIYRKETTDLLFNVLSPQPAVQPFVFLNLPGSEVVNEGIEFAINYRFFDTEDFSWDANFNISYNDNEITKLRGEFEAGEIRGPGLTNAFAQKLQEGQPLFSFFLREFEGFDPETGEPIQEDVQRFVGKSALPDYTAGFSTNLNYLRWSLSIYFNGQFGNYIYNNTRNAFFTAGSFGAGRNVTDNIPLSPESLNAAAEVSTRFLESGDFVRLQNINLSYDLPISGEEFFESVRFSGTVQNLFVLTSYSGLDPEISVQPGANALRNGIPVFGIDLTGYPRPRTFSVGLNATF